MAVLALQPFGAPLLVIRDCPCDIPLAAGLTRIAVKARLAAIVLPVVCEHAGLLRVLRIPVRTPNGLEVEQVEVGISLELA